MERAQDGAEPAPRGSVRRRVPYSVRGGGSMVARAMAGVTLRLVRGLFARGTGHARAQAPAAAARGLQWGEDGALVVLGSGFVPDETVWLTLSVRSEQSSVQTGPG